MTTALLSSPREFLLDLPNYTYYENKNKTNLICVDPTNGNIRANLNNSNVITFNYKASDTYINLGSNNTGIKAKISFLTRLNNANDAEADITLSNSFFLHLFNNVRLRLGNNEIENINNPGIIVDVMNILKNNRNENEGIILDGGGGGGGAVSRKINNPAVNAGAATVINSTTNNADYNKGYAKRKLKYNYTVTGNDVPREIEIFIPLSNIFGFCDSYDKVLKFTNIQIDLTRKPVQESTWCVFGIDTTSIRLGDTDNTGLMNIQLILEEVIPSADVILNLEERIKTPLIINFLQRTCELKTANQEQNYDISETQFSNPQYVIVVAKNSTADTAQRNSSLCLHSDMQEVRITLDGRDYPNISQLSNFGTNCFSMFYQQFKELCAKLNNENPISAQDFKNLYTIFCTDLTSQTPKLTSGISNLRISLRRRALPGTDADLKNVRSVHYYIIVLSESVISLDMLKRLSSKIR